MKGKVEAGKAVGQGQGRRGEGVGEGQGHREDRGWRDAPRPRLGRGRRCPCRAERRWLPDERPRSASGTAHRCAWSSRNVQLTASASMYRRWRRIPCPPGLRPRRGADGRDAVGARGPDGEAGGRDQGDTGGSRGRGPCRTGAAHRGAGNRRPRGASGHQGTTAHQTCTGGGLASAARATSRRVTSSVTRIDMAPAALGTTVNPDWLAYRAVANVPPCGGMSGGFADAGAAGTAIQAHSVNLPTTGPHSGLSCSPNGRIQRIVPVAGAGICFVNNQSGPSAALLPTWLGGPTNRKLHGGCVHATDDPPLAATGAPGGTELRILLNANAPNGWFVHSAWPTI